MKQIDQDEIAQLKDRLDIVQQEFEAGMRERGFDPQQAENLALTSALAKLFAERDDLRARLSSKVESGEEES